MPITDQLNDDDFDSLGAEPTPVPEPDNKSDVPNITAEADPMAVNFFFDVVRVGKQTDRMLDLQDKAASNVEAILSSSIVAQDPEIALQFLGTIVTAATKMVEVSRKLVEANTKAMSELRSREKAPPKRVQSPQTIKPPEPVTPTAPMAGVTGSPISTTPGDFDAGQSLENSLLRL